MDEASGRFGRAWLHTRLASFQRGGPRLLGLLVDCSGNRGIPAGVERHDPREAVPAYDQGRCVDRQQVFHFGLCQFAERHRRRFRGVAGAREGAVRLKQLNGRRDVSFRIAGHRRETYRSRQHRHPD